MKVDLYLDEWVTLLERILEIENSLDNQAWESFLSQILNEELRDYLLNKKNNNQFELELLEVINTWIENDPNINNKNYSIVTK